MTLTNESLPGLFQAADRASVRAQKRYLAGSRARLILVVLAAVAGALTVSLHGRRLDLAAGAAALLLLVAAFVELWLLIAKPEQAWYDGRTLAESAKTLAWRYAVAAAPFPHGHDQAAERLLVDQLRGLLRDAPVTAITPAAAPPVSEAMKNLRRAPLNQRKSAYLADRIEDQRGWYASKSTWNRRRARFWRVTLVTGEAAGVAAALLRMAEILTVDLAGIIAVMIAAAAAWLAIKQHDALTRAYLYAATELALVHGQLSAVTTEAAWATEAADAEEAMSREHTMWRAARSSS